MKATLHTPMRYQVLSKRLWRWWWRFGRWDWLSFTDAFPTGCLSDVAGPDAEPFGDVIGRQAT